MTVEATWLGCALLNSARSDGAATKIQFYGLVETWIMVVGPFPTWPGLKTIVRPKGGESGRLEVLDFKKFWKQKAWPRKALCRAGKTYMTEASSALCSLRYVVGTNNEYAVGRQTTMSCLHVPACGQASTMTEMAGCQPLSPVSPVADGLEGLQDSATLSRISAAACIPGNLLTS